MVLPTPLLNTASSNLPGLWPMKIIPFFKDGRGLAYAPQFRLCHKCCLPWPRCLPCLSPSYPSHSTDISTVHRDWQCVRKRRLAGKKNHFLKSLELLKFKFLGKGDYVCNNPDLSPSPQCGKATLLQDLLFSVWTIVTEARVLLSCWVRRLTS